MAMVGVGEDVGVPEAQRPEAVSCQPRVAQGVVGRDGGMMRPVDLDDQPRVQTGEVEKVGPAWDRNRISSPGGEVARSGGGGAAGAG
jgi:hypothetical protein